MSELFLDEFPVPLGNDRLVVAMQKVCLHLARIFHGFVGEIVSDKGFLHSHIPAILLIPQQIQNHPGVSHRTLSRNGRNASASERGGNGGGGVAVEVEVEDEPHDLCLFLDNDILIVLVFVVSENARAEGDADRKLFPYAVLDRFGLLCRLFLCHTGNESDHHFRCLVERVQIIVLKIDADRRVEVFEYADIAYAVHEVPGKTADRLCNDKVDLARLAVLDHTQEFLALFYRRCGYALVSIDAREFPGWVLTNDSFLVLDLQFKTTLLCYINRLVEEGFYYNAGTLRSVPVSIGGTKWKPDLPIESLVKEQLGDVLSIKDVYERALNALLFVTKKQLFIDGNKRTAVIFANHILISNGAGIVVIPEDKVGEYKKLLIHYYETDEKAEIIDFLYTHCLTKI